jgi:hypothetical protein
VEILTVGAVSLRIGHMTHRVIRHFGDRGTVELRRPHTLNDESLGTAPAALAVHGAHLAGVASITLRGTATLRGTLAKGCQVTISAVVYTAQADGAANTSGQLTVSISPVLAGNQSDGAAASISRPYGSYTFYRQRGADAVEQDIDGTAVRGRGRVLHLSAISAEVTPRQGDVIVEGTETVTVSGGVRAPNPGGGAVRYTVFAGELS